MYEDLFNYENNSNVDVSKISEEDLASLRLLTTQHYADIITLYSDILAYISTYESSNLIYRKYDNKPNNEQNPDITDIESLSLFMVARLLYSGISFEKYDMVIRSLEETGAEEYVIKKDAYEDIAKGNVFLAVGAMLLLKGAGTIYDYDSQLPVFGV